MSELIQWKQSVSLMAVNLRQDNQVLYKKVKDQHTEIHGLKEILQGLRKDIERSRNTEKGVLRTENAALRAENKVLKEEVDILQNQNEVMCKDMTGLQEHKAGIVTMLKKSKKAEAKGKRDLKQQIRKMRDMKTHYIILKQKNLSLEQQNRDLQKSIKDEDHSNERRQNKALHETIQEADKPTSQVLQNTMKKKHGDLQQESKIDSTSKQRKTPEQELNDDRRELRKRGEVIGQKNEAAQEQVQVQWDPKNIAQGLKQCEYKHNAMLQDNKFLKNSNGTLERQKLEEFKKGFFMSVEILIHPGHGYFVFKKLPPSLVAL
ncbi:hypothetical protein F2P81_015876 [Scophthalmus maximus]|uniref:Uncharacterized protein n=1 Tax=Scophthalmus maximus TaxID=52904 RepID=A0A6A4SJN3_SCOMX|nr:hypothetical protein F2P81_015876 [Scophthalmus maximus]